MDIIARVGELRAQGRDVVSLCVGEPSGGAPPDVSAAAVEIHSGTTALGYTPALGTQTLRERIAGHYGRWYGLDVDPSRVAVTTGSSGAFTLGFLAAFEAGDRVALARPGYPAYRNILMALGCEVVDIDCGPETRYQPTPDLLDEAAQEGPLAGLILASPANPTGTMVDRAELAGISAWCRANGTRLVSDEIYHGVTYPEAGAPDPRGVCAWELGDDAVVVSSFSKYWGMTGWRLGWMLLPDDLIRPVDALAGNLVLSPPAPAQLAAEQAFTEESYAACDARVADFARTRSILLEAAPRLGWGDAAPADGAFYYYADLGPQLARFGTSQNYATALLEEAGVAVTPGSDFDARHGSRCVRLSFAAGAAAVAEAVDRIVAFQA
ncbi:MAG: aminotransferase class I/II-fold pyridoxal phosphate-dependent enzyme [Micrococcales bacterium]|nr:aminotransferase class I/II-fold pyridoxal phosphate-dependent enzyme [Micrococcales bacterium]